MMAFKKKLVVIFSLLTYILFCQEVKIGLPLGSNNNITNAEFSSNGKLVLTISDEHDDARIWDVNTGKLLRILQGHTDKVTSSQFSQNGELVATTSMDGKTRLWELEKGKLLFILEGHEDAVTSAQFSPNGKFLITTALLFDNTARIWDVNTGKLVRTLEHTDPVNLAQFSPNSKLVVTSSDHITRLWDVNTGKILHILEGNNDWVKAALFSPDGELVIAISEENTIFLWEVKTGKLIRVFKGHTKSVNSALFSPDGKLIVTGSNDNTVRIWEVNTGQLVKILEGHTKSVNSALFSPDGKLILTASDDNTARIWEVNTGKLVKILNGHTESVNSARFSPDGKHIVTASNDNTARLWEVSLGKLIHNLDGHTVFTLHVQSSPDGKLIASILNNNTISIFNINLGKVTQILKGHSDSINSLQFSPDGKLILTASSDNTARLWEAYTGNLIKVLEKHSNSVNSAQFSPDGELILTASNDNSLRLRDKNSGELLHVLEYVDNGFISEFNSVSAEFSPDGKLIVAAYGDGKVRLWDVNTRKLVNILEHAGEVTFAQFNPDGKLIVTATDNNAHIRDVNTGEILHTFKHIDYGTKSIFYVKSAEFSPDGKLIVTAYGDGKVRLWDVNTRKLVNILDHGEAVKYAQFTQDGSLILTIPSSGNYISVWEVNTGKLIHKINGLSSGLDEVKVDSNRKFIISTSADGYLLLWDLDKREQFTRNFTFDSDPNKWVHLHPSGLFDASPEAMELMYWTKGLEVIEFSQLKDRYWLPGLWEKVMKGEKLPDVRNMSELKLQPEVEIKNITADDVTVHLTKREGGYGKVSLYINGKEAKSDIRSDNMDSTLTEQTISVSIKDHPFLLDGENEITVKASSEDGFVQGRGAVGKAIAKKNALNQPQFYGVVIGVGDYANKQLNLKYTVNDAEAIAKAMQIGAENLFTADRTNIYTITSKSDKLPNKQNIKEIFKEISNKANAEDIITVYLSGHGITWGGDQGDFYFLTSAATATTNEAYNDPVIRQNNTISTAEWVDWLKEIPALKQVMIIDACGSGKAVDNLIAERDIEPSQIKAIDRMKDRTGMYIISGCTADAVSYEASMYGQGLLTYSILQAMKGAALKEDKYVDIFTIMDYARETVPKLAEGIGGIQEPQLLIPRGGSFDIGMLSNIDKEAIPLANPKTVYIRSTLVNAEEFEDNLGLSELLNQELSLTSSKGKASPLVYFDSAKFPNACKISGGYTIEKNEIFLSLKIRCGEDLKSFDLKAKTKEALVKNIIELIDE
ncbi:caspase family protein [Maribacter chungangensis]|uniref:Caspase family protein n=1 Tax=Maribacter chungangensis TaxID=1069117 RepID=A0ABW3B2V8_9FLAO